MPPKVANSKAGKKKLNNNKKNEDSCAFCKVSESDTDEDETWVVCFVCQLWYHLNCITVSEQVK